MLREEKGITLVALIITIIILIILAAVTIMSFTNNKLIDTAVEGTQNYANSQKYEERVMDNIYYMFSNVVKNIETTQST